MLAANFPAQAAIRTERLTLSAVRPEHAPALLRLLDDWDVAKMLAEVPWPLTPADVEAFARRQGGTTEAENFAILAGARLIGCAGVKRPGRGDPPRTMPRLGYWIGRPFWNRGYATEAIGALVAYAFRVHPGDVVGAGVFYDNGASRRVLEKLGFEPAERYETRCLARRTMVETLDMRLTRGEWRGARS